MYGKLKAHNFFVTTLDAIVNDTDVVGIIEIADKTVNGITLEDGDYLFRILVGLNTPAELEIFRITNVANKTLTYDKRISPNGIQTHGVGDLVQCNDMGEFMNFLADNTDFFGYTETISGVGNELKVNVRGGIVIDVNNIDVTVADTILTLTDNSTQYIYFDETDFIFELSASEVGNNSIITKTITSSGAITSITDYRGRTLGTENVPVSMTEAVRNALTNVKNGTIIFNTTSGVSNRYEGGSWYDYASGTPVPRLSETVEGKARYSTGAEFLAQSNTGSDSASLVPKPSQAFIENQTITKIPVVNSVAPATPVTDNTNIYVDVADKKIKYKDDTGTVGVVATESVVDGKVSAESDLCIKDFIVSGSSNISASKNGSAGTSTSSSLHMITGGFVTYSINISAATGNDYIHMDISSDNTNRTTIINSTGGTAIINNTMPIQKGYYVRFVAYLQGNAGSAAGATSLIFDNVF